MLRGKWVLENVLGTPPPPPPDVVPPFEEEAGAAKPRSVRERMESHRRNPACASCHRMIDPAGLALENFDAIGAWRTRDGGTRGAPVDASGQLVDGTRINGVVELRQALLREPDTFVRTLTEKLMTYALGRGLTAADMPAVRAIVRDAEADQIPVLVDRAGHRAQRAVPDATEGSGFRTDGGRIDIDQPALRRGRASRGARHVHHEDVRCPVERCCVASVPRWRCRCSTPWCRR